MKYFDITHFSSEKINKIEKKLFILRTKIILDKWTFRYLNSDNN